MGRCQHKNFKIIEHQSTETCFDFSDGKPPEKGYRSWESDPITDCIEVACYDCDFQQFYGPHAKRPKWVQHAWDALLAEQKFEL